MNVLGSYRNGNYNVTIFNDGTKIRENDLDFFDAEFPENMDVKITNMCDMGCPYCHEASTPNGMHGDILNEKFIDSLAPFTEMAIGGGNVLTHPDLIKFLIKLRMRNIIPNITINQEHFMRNIDLLAQLAGKRLIFGIGVSLTNPSDAFIEQIKMFKNAVVHVINKIVTTDDLDKLSGNGLKILILGYKMFRKGDSYWHENIKELSTNDMFDKLPEYMNKFNAISFDNLALEQLQVKRLMSKERWSQFYMGDDGQHTMYIDLVERKFAKNSTSVERFDMEDNIVSMFEKVKTKPVKPVKLKICPTCNGDSFVYDNESGDLERTPQHDCKAFKIKTWGCPDCKHGSIEVKEEEENE